MEIVVLLKQTSAQKQQQKQKQVYFSVKKKS